MKSWLKKWPAKDEMMKEGVWICFPSATKRTYPQNADDVSRRHVVLHVVLHPWGDNRENPVGDGIPGQITSGSNN